MRTAIDDLRDHAKRRDVVCLELVACLAAAAALWRIAGRIEMALPEAQTIFLTIAMAFGFAFARFLSEGIAVLAYRCPRCDGRFHASAKPPALRLRSCTHCGLRASDAASRDASDGAEAPPRG